MTGFPFRRRETQTNQPNQTEPLDFIRPNFRAAAELATVEIKNKYAAIMAEVMKDKSLNKEQRDSALLSLKLKKQSELQAARNKTRDEEAQKEKAFRQYQRTLKRPHLPSLHK